MKYTKANLKGKSVQELTEIILTLQKFQKSPLKIITDQRPYTTIADGTKGMTRG